MVPEALFDTNLLCMRNIITKVPKTNYRKLSELGSEFNLSFSSHLVLANKIIGLDGIKKCLLISETNKQPNNPYIIELSKVIALSVKRNYGSISVGELKKRGVQEFLKRIELQFEFIDTNEPFVLPIYDCEIDDQLDLPRLERTATNWYLILSKILGLERKQILSKKTQGRITDRKLV